MGHNPCRRAACQVSKCRLLLRSAYTIHSRAQDAYAILHYWYAPGSNPSPAHGQEHLGLHHSVTMRRSRSLGCALAAGHRVVVREFGGRRHIIIREDRYSVGVRGAAGRKDRGCCDAKNGDRQRAVARYGWYWNPSSGCEPLRNCKPGRRSTSLVAGLSWVVCHHVYVRAA